MSKEFTTPVVTLKSVQCNTFDSYVCTAGWQDKLEKGGKTNKQKLDYDQTLKRHYNDIFKRMLRHVFYISNCPKHVW